MYIYINRNQQNKSLFLVVDKTVKLVAGSARKRVCSDKISRGRTFPTMRSVDSSAYFSFRSSSSPGTADRDESFPASWSTMERRTRRPVTALELTSNWKSAKLQVGRTHYFPLACLRSSGLSRPFVISFSICVI